MKCIDRTLLQRYFDGEVSTDEHTGVEAHLLGCAACKERYRLLQQRNHDLRELLGPTDVETVRPPLPSYLDGKLTVGVAAAPVQESPGSKRVLLKRWGYGLSAACLLTAVFLYKPLMVRSQPTPMVLMQQEIVEVDANRPYDEQETVMHVITPDGSVGTME